MKLRFGLSLFIVLSFVSQLAMARSGGCGEEAYWVFDEASGTLTIAGEGKMADYDRPTHISPKLPGWNDLAEDIKHVVIEEGITTVGNSVFDGYKSLETVVLPEGITYIGNYAFFSCPMLKEVTLPQSLERIGEALASYVNHGYSFAECIRLEKINIPKNVKLLAGGSFNRCKALATVDWDAVDCQGDANLAGRYEGMFVGAGVQTVNFGPEVKTVPSQLFESVGSLTVVTAKGSIDYVGYSAFKGTMWENIQDRETVIYIDNAAYLYAIDSTVKSGIDIKFKDGTRGITDYLFGGTDRLEKVHVPETVTRVGAHVFRDCQSLSEVTWEPVDVEFIDAASSKYSRLPASIRKITFGDKVKTLPSYFLANCTALKEVELPQSLVSIGNNAFEKCGVRSLVIPDGVTKIGSGALYYCTKLTTLTIGEGVTDLDWNYFLAGSPVNTLYWNAVRVTPNNIYPSASARCCALVENFIAGDKVEYIPTDIFYKSTSLKNVHLGKSVEEIGERAFYECTELTEIELPTSLKIINQYAFYRAGLKSVVIPENVTALMPEAFNTSSIRTVVFTPLTAPSNLAFDIYADPIFYVSDEDEYQKYSVMRGWPFKGQIVPLVTPDITEFEQGKLDEKVTFTCNIPDYELEILAGPDLDDEIGKHRCIVEGKFIGDQTFTSKFVYDYEVKGAAGIESVTNDEAPVDIYNVSGIKISEELMRNLSITFTPASISSAKANRSIRS